LNLVFSLFSHKLDPVLEDTVQSDSELEARLVKDRSLKRKSKPPSKEQPAAKRSSKAAALEEMDDDIIGL